MTIEDLEKILESIPKTGAINIARRRAILKKIYELMNEENK